MRKKIKQLDYYELWIKPEYTESGISELVRIVYTYGRKSALEFISPEFRHQIKIIKYRR